MIIDQALIGSVFTVFVLLVFVCIVCWTFSKRNTKRFEEAAKLVFDDEYSDSAARKNTES